MHHCDPILWGWGSSGIGHVGAKSRPVRAAAAENPWWGGQDSNLRPEDYEYPALTY